jgi:predicted membrane channel-forming protein YqfA (hemolysin III family)
MRWRGTRAGSFTPICLVFLYNSGVGWALLGTLWLLAFCGIALTISAFDHLPKCARLRAARHARAFAHLCPSFVPIVCADRSWVPFTMFITMGWMGALLAVAVYPFVGVGGIALVAAGGVAYSVRSCAYACARIIC